MDNFARCILEDDRSMVPGEMGKRAMIILDVIYESGETGRKASLDFDKGEGYIRPPAG